jgi:transcriptional regulator with XRE-family HTH domain
MSEEGIRPVGAKEELGLRIRRAREQAGLTQTQLATTIRWEQTALSRVETGGREVTSLLLARIAEATAKPLGYFLTPAPSADGVLLRAPEGAGTGTLEAVDFLRAILDDYDFLRHIDE